VLQWTERKSLQGACASIFRAHVVVVCASSDDAVEVALEGVVTACQEYNLAVAQGKPMVLARLTQDVDLHQFVSALFCT
jgi:hypothetical protein